MAATIVATVTQTGFANASKTYTFAAAPISWEVIPDVSNQNKIRFVVKISGAIS